MTDLWLPDLERDPRGRVLAYTDPGEPKGCLHTTESTGWPSYRGWTVHPQATVLPIPGKGVRGRQHVPLNRAGFALRNLPGGVQTNTDRVAQVELIGTCERGGKVHQAGAYLWPDADDAVLLDLYRKVIEPMSRALGIPLRAPAFQAYPPSYGDRRPDGRTNVVRMSGPEFDAYSGWLGHQHVPENIHGDPGAFPWDRMMQLAGRAEDDRPTRDDDRRAPIGRYLKRTDPMTRGADVKAVQRVVDVDPDGWFGDDTRAGVKRAQRRRGLDPDGIVGPLFCRAHRDELRWTGPK